LLLSMRSKGLKWVRFPLRSQGENLYPQPPVFCVRVANTELICERAQKAPRESLGFAQDLASSDAQFSKCYECLASRHLPVREGSLVSPWARRPAVPAHTTGS